MGNVVLRLHEQGEPRNDWSKTNKYGDDVINQISDPTGETSDKEITSIPSPFARIDLARTAFHALGTSTKPLEGKTAYHKILSDCLDVGELLFFYNRMSNKLCLMVWDRKKQIAELRNSGSSGQTMLANALEMYMEQDAEAYNFKDMDRFYILGYKGKMRKNEIDIIGATSPCTFFFSSANDLSYMSEDLRQNGKDKPFDDEYTPLYKRSIEFQQYLWALVYSKGKEGFAKAFPDFYAYLLRSYYEAPQKVKDMLDKVDENSIEDFEPFTIDGNTVEVMGIAFRNGKGIKSNEMESDFIMESKIYKGVMPLVLPVEEGNTYTGLKYIQDKWESTVKAPYVDSSAISERTLPASSQKYPYITISDFLQPSIIAMPYQLNKKCFFDGNSDKDGKSYLLPLKETFFDFFSIKDLEGFMKDGKPMIEMKTFAAGSVKVFLRIPIQGGRYIEYSRKYVFDGDPNEATNEGSVFEKKFGLGIFPLVSVPSLHHYRVAFFSRKRATKLMFAGNGMVTPKDHVIRREPDKELCGVESFVIEKPFDRIFASIDASTGVIVPKFADSSNSCEFTFAIDFGTSNTHIEYRQDDESDSHPFVIGEEEKQLVRLHEGYGKDADIEDAFEDAFIPQTVGAGEGYAFPIRTALAEWNKINYQSTTNSFAQSNVPFRYEKAGIPAYNKVKTGIKWSSQNEGVVRLYLDNIFYLIRNKVLCKNGRLEDTRIVWFYPASMSKGQATMFENIWKELYEKYFGDNTNNIKKVSESVAPYYYYAKRGGAKSNVVTIDIGGGTTDVFIVDDNSPKMLSSFRFACNSMFGDSYNSSAEDNGFVKVFERPVISILQGNKLDDLIEVYKSIRKTNKSSDIIDFFFSLKTNKDIVEKQIPLDFQKMLAKDGKMKFVVVVFYGAILYYVATMMKARGLALPKTLAFSGNGSRTLSILSTDNEVLAQFARLIFEKVYGEKYGSDQNLDLKFDGNPKLATCKGGIQHKDVLSFDEVATLGASLLGSDKTTFACGQKYNEAKASIKQVASSVSSFVDFLFDLDKENKGFFLNNFIVDGTVTTDVRRCCKLELEEYTLQGYNKKIEELKTWGQDEDSEIEETMFFYPIVPMLNNLARELAK